MSCDNEKKGFFAFSFDAEANIFNTPFHAFWGVGDDGGGSSWMGRDEDGRR